MEWLEIFDISLFRSVLRSMTPIALIGFGAAMCSAAGVLNIGLEGKMLNAAFIGVAASYYSGSALTGFICGVLAGVLTAILFGVLSFNLGADEVLAGLAINIFAIAFTRYLLETLFDRRGFFSDPSIQGIDPIEIGFLKDTRFELIFSGYTPSVYLIFFLAILLYFVYYKTRLGTAIRATGENPEAAEDAGINTVKMKWLTVLFSGILAGIGGTFLSLENMTLFTEGMSAGKGYIGLVASSFGFNTPLGTFGASGFFGLGDAIGIRLQGVYELDSRLVLMIPYALTVVVLILIGVRQRYRVRRVPIDTSE